jgi:anthranilate phosphoribosyltransferase
VARRTWPDLLTGLIAGRDLDADAAAWAMDQILAGEVTPVQIAGFAVALRAKGETVGELTGLAQAMLDRATRIRLSREAVDVVGSGGDRANTVNVSTMAAIVAARCELGVQTTFNFLGPLANPAQPLAQAVGVANERMAPLVAGVIAARGHRGIVFHGDDGLDELTTTTASRLWLVVGGEVVETTLDPAALGLARSRADDLVGGSPAHNAGVVRAVLAGEPGPVRDIVALNAAAACLAFDGVRLDAPIEPQFAPALARAQHAIDSGAAAAVLDRWIAATRPAA